MSLSTCENEIVKPAEKFYEAHGFPQCIGAIDGTHIRIKKPISNLTDFINTKRTYSLNVQAAVDYKFCFFDVAVKWLGSVHDARLFSNFLLNKKPRDESIPKCGKTIVPGEPAVPICLLGNPAYPLLPYILKEFSYGGENNEEQFCGYRLSSAWLVIECTFGRLKARFGCLNRNMDINLPNVIYACFVLHNFCKIHKESIHQNDVNNALKKDAQFQPQIRGSYTINNNEGNGKAIRNIFVKYLN